MSTRKVFERTDVQHETPPSAVCCRPHVAVLKSDQLPLVGGGSLPAPDICRPITSEYAEEALSAETVEDLVENVGLDLDELAVLKRIPVVVPLEFCEELLDALRVSGRWQTSEALPSLPPHLASVFVDIGPAGE